MKRPITATTVIALALGTAAVVAPTATANNYGLRGEDGNGVIARGDQKVSDCLRAVVLLGLMTVQWRVVKLVLAGTLWIQAQPALR